jgi:hypothetical protein
VRYVPHLALLGFVLAVAAGLALSGSARVAAKPNDLKVGRFASVTIEKQGVPSALDIHLDGKGRAVQFFAPPWEGTPQPGPRTYFNDVGMLYTNGWVTISGTYTGKGADYHIEPPTKDPSMLAVWSDVLGPAIQVRAANAGPASYIFQALDRNANYTFGIEQNGALRWGAASRAEMDVNLYRAAAKTLKTDGALVVAKQLGVGTSEPASTLHVKGSRSVQRTAVQADYTLTDTDYYVGITNTASPRTIALPSASGREGRVYVIKDESGGAAAHPIAVTAPSGETIDGDKTTTIRTNYGVLRLISSGKNWFGM